MCAFRGIERQTEGERESGFGVHIMSPYVYVCKSVCERHPPSLLSACS